MNDFVLRHAETDGELRACFPVMRELRPHLADEAGFLEQVRRLMGEGYRLLATWEDEVPLALAGYRVQQNLIFGRFLYVDDLVVTAASRGDRLGRRLLDELSSVAKRSECAQLVLDTGLSNALAQRFYFREGLLTGAIRFSKPLSLEQA
ncbi:GNAT family N-acetyltransferase [Cupriavidus basilensis]|uniref:GNAT family N-acetyltransferase n=1 Tax=Cupriavidus basilensis TaxID=68895 RepID=A0ABT6AG85_9BURK|nr:GNAT family N-acetyltransferase [Cupriavidus basilensis]MDF3831605.1 GNAT family N-acetyltransferase [Cupriavidus basilensis]